ncbi:MAG: hypothetical protein ACK59A_07090 [Cyanobacteriota bacterium]
MSQDTHQPTEAKQAGLPAPQRLTAEGSRHWLEQQVWPLPLLEARCADEIRGYGDDGLC